MKGFKKAIALLTMVVLMASFGYAQTSPKFGYIDSNEILSLMPETDSLQNELKAYADYLDQQMSTMAMEFQTKVTDYQENFNTMSDLEIETPRNDAGNGLLLLGDGKGAFNPVPGHTSGFFARKDAKKIGMLKNNGHGIIVVANNDDTVQFFKVK